MANRLAAPSHHAPRGADWLSALCGIANPPHITRDKALVNCEICARILALHQRGWYVLLARTYGQSAQHAAANGDEHGARSLAARAVHVIRKALGPAFELFR